MEFYWVFVFVFMLVIARAKTQRLQQEEEENNPEIDDAEDGWEEGISLCLEWSRC
jgi:hypothetical protein